MGIRKRSQRQLIDSGPKKNPPQVEIPHYNDFFEPEAVEIPIDGILDLHAFQPKEVKGLLNNYIDECLKRGIYHLRIIHGKGSGTLKAVVRSLLKKHPAVLSFKDADLLAGGWGATEVTLSQK
ncbi:MAG: Smr/MutS family protein [Candidatus Aminicenantales bacterium]